MVAPRPQQRTEIAQILPILQFDACEFTTSYEAHFVGIAEARKELFVAD
jgi:hypothetical protein